MRTLLTSLSLLLALQAGGAMADDIRTQRLYHIERNTNANIVVYDAQVLPNGDLAEKDPVIVYWVRLAEEGQRKDLKRIERKMAYGFKVASREGNRLELEMVADVGRQVEVGLEGEAYRAFMTIDGHRARLEKIFISAEGSLKPTVNYLELFGVDVETGEARYEKFKP